MGKDDASWQPSKATTWRCCNKTHTSKQQRCSACGITRKVAEAKAAEADTPASGPAASTRRPWKNKAKNATSPDASTSQPTDQKAAPPAAPCSETLRSLDSVGPADLRTVVSAGGSREGAMQHGPPSRRSEAEQRTACSIRAMWPLSFPPNPARLPLRLRLLDQWIAQKAVTRQLWVFASAMARLDPIAAGLV